MHSFSEFVLGNFSNKFWTSFRDIQPTWTAVYPADTGLCPSYPSLLPKRYSYARSLQISGLICFILYAWMYNSFHIVQFGTYYRTKYSWFISMSDSCTTFILMQVNRMMKIKQESVRLRKFITLKYNEEEILHKLQYLSVCPVITSRISPPTGLVNFFPTETRKKWKVYRMLLSRCLLRRHVGNCHGGEWVWEHWRCSSFNRGLCVSVMKTGVGMEAGCSRVVRGVSVMPQDG